jgi:hypothetical protein
VIVAAATSEDVQAGSKAVVGRRGNMMDACVRSSNCVEERRSVGSRRPIADENIVDCWDTEGTRTSSIGDGVLIDTFPLAEFRPLAEFGGRNPRLDSLYPCRFADLEVS